MKYRKASDILPDELLREVQKYIEGEALYIPKGNARKKWGRLRGEEHFSCRGMKKYVINSFTKYLSKLLRKNTIFLMRL
jgi:hypothetical protein